MRYNFDIVTERRNTKCKKFDDLQQVFGTTEAIPLWIADMDFETAPPVVQALKDKAAHGIFGYAQMPPSYFQSYADWQKKRNDWSIDPSMMSFSQGVVYSVRTLMMMYAGPGEKILVQTPSYPPFLNLPREIERQIVINELRIDDQGIYRMDLKDFEEKASHGDIRVFALVNPHNPTGRTWSREELSAVADLCLKYKIRIIADEIHSDIILKDGRHIPMASLSDEVAAITTTCLSPTKTFNLAGIQTSIIHFSTKEDKALYDEITARTHVGNSNSFAVCATETAFAEGEDWLAQMKDYVYDNIVFVNDFLREQLPQIKSYIPQGTYLMWLDMRALGMDAKELMKFMLFDAHLALNGGDAFGKNGEGYMRLNCATPRSILEQAMKQLKTAIDAR